MCHTLQVTPRVLAMGKAARHAPPSRQLTVTLPATLFETFRAEAEARSVPIAAVVRGVLEKGVA